MPIQAVCYRILVRVKEVAEKSKGGIVLAVDKKIEKNAYTQGTIVDIGEDAYAAFHPKTEHAGLKIGDIVFYAKYSGKWIEDPETGENLLMLNDEDVCGKWVPCP